MINTSNNKNKWVLKKRIILLDLLKKGGCPNLTLGTALKKLITSLIFWASQLQNFEFENGENFIFQIILSIFSEVVRIKVCLLVFNFMKFIYLFLNYYLRKLN